MGDEPPRVANEDLEDRPLGRGQADGSAVPHDLFCGEVDGERLGLDQRLLGPRRRAAQRRPQPGEQLVHAERLRDVVVGSGVERRDLRRLLVRGPRGRSPGRRSSREGRGRPRPRPSPAARGRGGRGPGGRARQRQGRLSGRREVDVVPRARGGSPRARAASAARRRRRAPGSCGRLPQAQYHREAAAGRVLDLDRAPHRLDESSRNREAEANPLAGAARRRAAGTAGTSLRARGRHAGASIEDAEVDHPAGRARRRA